MHRSSSSFSSMALKINCFGIIHILNEWMILAIHLVWWLAQGALNRIFWDDAPLRNNNTYIKSSIQSLRNCFSVVNNKLLIKLIIPYFMSAIPCAAISSVKALLNFSWSLYSQKHTKSWISGAEDAGITVLNAARGINSSTWWRHEKYNRSPPKTCSMITQAPFILSVFKPVVSKCNASMLFCTFHYFSTWNIAWASVSPVPDGSFGTDRSCVSPQALVPTEVYVIAELLFGGDLLYFSCRHHVLELIPRAAFKTVIPASSAPEIQLFVRFWEYNDQEKFNNAFTDEIAAHGIADIK